MNATQTHPTVPRAAICALALVLACQSATAPQRSPVVSLRVTPESASVALGATLQLTAVPLDAMNHELTGRTVTWQSATPAVATVDASGLVTAVRAGVDTIIATSERRSTLIPILVGVLDLGEWTLSITRLSLWDGLVSCNYASSATLRLWRADRVLLGRASGLTLGCISVLGGRSTISVPAQDLAYGDIDNSTVSFALQKGKLALSFVGTTSDTGWLGRLRATSDKLSGGTWTATKK